LRPRAYSLLEAAVVLAIIAALTALAIPLLRSSGVGASDAAARQSLSAVVEDQFTIRSVDGAFSSDPARLSRVDTERSFVSGSSSSDATDVVSVVASGEVFAGAALGDEGTCWYLRRDAQGGPDGETWAFLPAASTCLGDDALELPASSSAAGTSKTPLDLSQD
jgi:competence protein ComGC